MIDNTPDNQTELLNRQLSSCQLTLPYHIKKDSVFILLIEIFYIVAIIVLIILGLFFLFFSSSPSSYSDELSKVITQWNRSSSSKWKKLSITTNVNGTSIVFSLNDSHSFGTPLFYSVDGASLFESTELLKKYSDILSYSYNLTASISLNISGMIITVPDIDIIIKTMSKMGKEDCQRNQFVFNEENEQCYQFFTVKCLCLVIDFESGTLDKDYKKFKCNQFTQWYESFKVLKWSFLDTTPGKSEIKGQGAIEIRILSSEDPYVWESFNREAQGKEGGRSFTLGIWMVLLAIGLIFFGLWMYFKDLGEKEKARIANIKQHHKNHIIQMAEFTESSESDTKVKIPIPLATLT